MAKELPPEDEDLIAASGAQRKSSPPPKPPPKKPPKPEAKKPTPKKGSRTPRGKGKSTPTLPSVRISKLNAMVGGPVVPPPSSPSPTPTPAPTPTPTPTPTPAPAASAGVRNGLKSIRAPKPTAPKAGGRSRVRGGLTTLAAVLGGVLAGRALMRTPTDTSEIDEAVNQAVRRSKGERVAKLLEQARMERTLAQNQARLAQANPTLYTSVMAGRKVPTGAVVLGGRPRTDLMRELAASMDSGAFQKRDPLSDLMG